MNVIPEGIVGPVGGLLGICVASAAVELLVGEEGAASSLRLLCGAAAAVCALRAVLDLLMI